MNDLHVQSTKNEKKTLNSNLSEKEKIWKKYQNSCCLVRLLYYIYLMCLLIEIGSIVLPNKKGANSNKLKVPACRYCLKNVITIQRSLQCVLSIKLYNCSSLLRNPNRKSYPFFAKEVA